LYTLKKNQHLLFKLITAPEGVHCELKKNWARLPIVGDKKLSAADRLDIYANMYFYRILDSLKEDYPMIHKIIGDSRFHNLVTDYLLKHPSTHFSMRDVGKQLARFLKKHASIKSWPYLSDLAKLEWGLIEAFDAKNNEILTENDLTQLKPEDWGTLQLTLVDSAKMIHLDFEISPLLKKKNTILVWRKNLEVCYRTLNPLEAKLLAGIKNQKTFAQLCESAKDPSLVASYLKRWLNDAVLQKETL
jgi:hypothetical protein